MPPLLHPRLWLADALPVSPNVFMLSMVLCASAAAVIIVFNVLSLKHRSTSRAAVTSIILLLTGFLLSTAAVGYSYESGSLDLLGTIPGIVACVMAVAAAVCALVGLVQIGGRHRLRRGRKRAFGSLFSSVFFVILLFSVTHRARHPLAPVLPKTKVALLPESTPPERATPPPVAPAPFPPAPAPEATPQPRLFPNVIIPN